MLHLSACCTQIPFHLVNIKLKGVNSEAGLEEAGKLAFYAPGSCEF